MGMNHKTAAVEAREKAAANCHDAPTVVARLKNDYEAREVFYLATCNRVEILAVTENVSRTKQGMQALLAVSEEKNIYTHQGIAAVSHLLQVAASLDSLVVGEPQILGQMKSAYGQTIQAGGAGLIVNKLLHFAFRTAKLIREHTRIAANPVSISYAAVELAKRIFAKLSDKRVLLAGAGDMALLAAKHLQATGVKEMVFTNRTFPLACDLAESFHGRSLAFAEMTTGIADADIVISSTGASNYIITAKMLTEALQKRRKQRPLFIIDIAVPRDVEPAVGDIDGVYLYNIDELQTVVDDNLAMRQEEAQKAIAMVAVEVEKFAEWLMSLELLPTIIALRGKIFQIVDDELGANKGWLAALPASDQERVRHLLRAVANKILHSPSEKLKEEQASDMAQGYSVILKDLFSL